MTLYWQKMLAKVADCMFTIPQGFALWPSHTHKPLVVAIICPIAPVCPWVQRGSARLVKLKSDVQEMWSLDPKRSGDRLREYWIQKKEAG
jgi:hypothetical protein